jgi:pyruvate dehydrogenase E2 component (dihydrolipoamide acetyltransferase)
MAKKVVMPALGMAQETGTLIHWFKAAGDRVNQGEPLMEIETDKATVEVEAPASGILASVGAQPGDVVPVGTTIAWILDPGEAPPAAVELPIGAAEIALKTAGSRLPARGPGAVESAGPIGDAARIPMASPKARRLARQAGQDLTARKGSGPHGEILSQDLESGGAGSAEAAQPVSRIWEVMVGRLQEAWPATPQFYLMRELDAAGLIAWKQEVAGGVESRISFTDLLLQLSAIALREHPQMNASWRDGKLIMHSQVHLGLAVAVDEGLLVPVIHSADRLDLAELAARRGELVSRARQGRLTPADLTGGTFTLSNLGMYGVDAFLGIVNPPQAALLTVGRIAERVVAVDGAPAVRPRIALGLSVDHRAADGARAAAFFQRLGQLVESPPSLAQRG